jgi:hypothetical protein
MAIHRRCHPSSRQRTYSEGGQRSGWAGFRPSLGRALRLRFVGISVAMYELPLPVLAAIDLGHPQIERYGLILIAHVCLGALEADPRAPRKHFTAAGEQGRVPFISLPNLARSGGHIAPRSEERCWEFPSNQTSQRFGVAAHILGGCSVALTDELCKFSESAGMRIAYPRVLPQNSHDPAAYAGAASGVDVLYAVTLDSDSFR